MRHRLFFALALLLLPCLLQAGELTGHVVAISDGDTFTLLTNNQKQIKIRLAEIDTPESKQPYGSKAKQVLASLIFDKIVNVNAKTIDKYGRTVGRVYVGKTDVNAEMVRQGAAWVYRQYASDQNLFALEKEAQANKAGLWSLPEAQRMAPWQWRHANRTSPNDETKSTPAQQTNTNKNDARCAKKSTCKQMTTCEEATFYLEQCGISSLDRDDDGVPCESLCR
jgi:endonuclease YncB( thermonuclease family)